LCSASNRVANPRRAESTALPSPVRPPPAAQRHPRTSRSGRPSEGATGRIASRIAGAACSESGKESSDESEMRKANDERHGS
jgi:hypothetical protein